MKKMKKIVSAVLCAFLFGLVDSMGKYFPPSGPRLPGETGKYVYPDGASTKHCLYCPKDAFKNTANNKKTQAPACINKYDNISAEITPYELENRKIPVCKVGEVPGCGPPPEVKKTADYVWYCDPGYSNVNYSVYFSCILIHKHTQVVTWSYYCNESLKWVLDSNRFSINQSAVTTTPKGATDDSTSFKIVVIIACAVVTLLVVLLAALTYCLCRKRHQNGSQASEDAEASKTLVVKQPSPSNQSNCFAGNETSTSTEGSVSECDVTEMMNTGVEKTNEMSNERLPPYGQEGPKHTVGYQTMTDLSNSTTVSLQSNPDNLSSLAPTCRCHLPADSSDGNHNTHMPTVRAEFQSSIISNQQVCRPFHQHRNSSSEVNGHIQSVLEMKPVDFQEFSNNINNLNQGQEREHSKDSRRDRPNPPGRISNNMCPESGYFDDENDKRHNTALKQRVNDSVTEYPECSNCGNDCHQQSQHGDTNFDSAERQRASRCICTSRSSSNEFEEGLINDNEEILEGDESFEIESQQLKFL